MKEAPVEVEGVIHTVLPGTMFRVELDNKHLVLATTLAQFLPLGHDAYSAADVLRALLHPANSGAKVEYL